MCDPGGLQGRSYESNQLAQGSLCANSLAQTLQAIDSTFHHCLRDEPWFRFRGLRKTSLPKTSKCNRVLCQAGVAHRPACPPKSYPRPLHCGSGSSSKTFNLETLSCADRAPSGQQRPQLLATITVCTAGIAASCQVCPPKQNDLFEHTSGNAQFPESCEAALAITTSGRIRNSGLRSNRRLL